MQTSTVTDPIQDWACEIGQKFNCNTGDITLTNATETTLLYIKNNGDDPIVITAFIYNLGASTSGTGDIKIDIVRNPTTGGIITNTNETAVDIATAAANQNFGSSEVVNGVSYKGATGEAVVNGDVTISTRSASITGRIVISLGAIIIPKGKSIAVNYTPPTSNSSQIVQVAAAMYVKTKDVEAN
jgi:urease beta subunit